MFIYLVWLTIFIISPLLVANDDSQFIKYSMESGKIKRFMFKSREGIEKSVVTEFQAPPENNLYFAFDVFISNKCDGKEKIIVYNEKSSIRNCSTPSNDGSDILKEACKSPMPTIRKNTKNVAYLQICSFGITEFGILMYIHSQGKLERPIDSNILASLQSRRINLDGCGKSKNHSRYPGNENGLDLKDRSMVIGGQEANPHSYPWMVLMIVDIVILQESYKKQCGGALLNNEWVLTAGHCVVNHENKVLNPDKLNLYLGAHSHSILAHDPKEKTKKCSTSKIILHEKYGKGVRETYNDVALIKMDCSVTYSETISPICLPTSPDDNLNEYDNIDIILAGWGDVADKKIEPDHFYTKVLKEAFVETMGNYILKGDLKNYKDVIYIYGQDSNVCPGDSGGPVMIYDKDNEHFIEYGVNSGVFPLNGVECVKETLSFFVFVPKYIKWIIENIDD